MKKTFPIFISFIITLLIASILLAPKNPVKSIVVQLEHLSYDFRLHLNLLTHKTKIDMPIAIIDIDDRSLKEIGHWPWPRKKMSELVEALKNYEAGVIAFDIFFSEAERNPYQQLFDNWQKKPKFNSVLPDLQSIASQANGDAILAKSFAGANVILALAFSPKVTSDFPLIHKGIPSPVPLTDLHLIHARGFISNIPALTQKATGSGFINIFADSDGIMRHAPLVMQYGNAVYPSLALRAVEAFTTEPLTLDVKAYGQSQKIEAVNLGTERIPVNENGELLIPFVGGSYTFPYYSAVDVLNHHIDKKDLAGKILFIGSSATGVGDLHATAIGNPYPGVEIQATIVNSILENHFFIEPAWVLGYNLFMIILLGSIASVLFPYLGPRALSIMIIVVPCAILLMSNEIWTRYGYVLPWILQFVVILLISIFNMLYGYLFEARKREYLKQMFGQYVPSKHIDEMLAQSSNYALAGESREMSVLFADIRNFTSISEKMTAAEIVSMLNTYLTPMTEVIFKYRGTIDKYVGDLIMAFWGAPLNDKKHAKHAMHAAIEMQKRLTELRKTFLDKGLPAIHIGIGINSGSMNVGDMGSEFRRNYTVIGDAVNLGSRIESLTKHYGVDIMASEDTVSHHQKDFVLRKIDVVRVKGKQDSVSIYEVIALQKERTDEMSKELAAYHAALEKYLKRQWKDAENAFHDLEKQYGEKKIYRIYLERIAIYQNEPPPDDWDGSFTHTSK